MRAILMLCATLAFSLHASALQQVTPAAGDAQVGYVNYSPDQVTLIRVQRGALTRIVLAPDEHILDNGAATGQNADCSKPDNAWCVHAERGANQVLLRPRASATDNNLELRTDKRDYSFRFEVADQETPAAQTKPHAAHSALAMYRVIFRYPEAAKDTAATAGPPAAAALARAARPLPRNWQYTMQALPGAEDIAPSLVFDDGRFTYFQFAASRELPTIFVISAAGEEARINFHIDEHDPGMVVVERLGHRFVLRLGSAVVGIWNEAFDIRGRRPVDNSTVDGMVRDWR